MINIKYIQSKDEAAPNNFKNASEIILAATEELGEVAQEVALIEKIGTKAFWKKEPSKERLGEEIRHIINCLIGLANYYNIDLDQTYFRGDEIKTK